MAGEDELPWGWDRGREGSTTRPLLPSQCRRSATGLLLLVATAPLLAVADWDGLGERPLRGLGERLFRGVAGRRERLRVVTAMWMRCALVRVSRGSRQI